MSDVNVRLRIQPVTAISSDDYSRGAVDHYTKYAAPISVAAIMKEASYVRSQGNS